MYALLIPRQIKPDHKGHFIESLKEHGRGSKASEPDTKRYEFYQDPDDTNRIWLYEAYTDKAAWGCTLKVRHTFRQWTQVHGCSLALSCVVHLCQLSDEPSSRFLDESK